jgi:hypothetical protein
MLDCASSRGANSIKGLWAVLLVCRGYIYILVLVWKLKSPSGLKGVGEKISSFSAQSPLIPKGI